MPQILQNLSDAGVALWLDDLSRPRLSSGGLARLVKEDGIVGVTTNPTIFAKAIGAGSGYEDQIRDLALRSTAIGEALRMLTTWDVRTACDVLRPIYDNTDGLDGRVSIEVDPRISGDAERTTAEARALWWLVDRPNLFIKIPATLDGLPAIEACISEGLSVNVTLIFSLERYKGVVEAFLKGLERRDFEGESLAGIESVASFFVSRVDTEIDRRLGEVSDRAEEAARLHGMAAIANARLAYEYYEQVVKSARWQALAKKGARMQRVLWASTSVKDKTQDDTRYVVELAAPNTVNTMPEATLRAVADHGHLRQDPVRQGYRAAQATLAAIEHVGIDMREVAATLEREGVASFMKSWDELISSVEKQIREAGGDVQATGAVKPAAGDKDEAPPSAAR